MTRNTLGRSCLLEANLILVAGVTNTYRLRWLRRVTDRQGATVARPMDLTGWTPIMQIRRDRLIVFDLTPYVRLDEHGCITITVPADTTRDLPEGSAAWDLLLAAPNGDTTRLAAGSALIESTVSITTKEPIMIRTLNSCNCDDLVTIIDDAIVMEGQKGESAYETAVRLGYQGTEAEWVDSLHGKGITLGHGDPTSQLTAREGDGYLNADNGDLWEYTSEPDGSEETNDKENNHG